MISYCKIGASELVPVDNNDEDFSEETFEHELCCGINPDTVVAEGLAIRCVSRECILYEHMCV